jgi:hypothetical protein
LLWVKNCFKLSAHQLINFSTPSMKGGPMKITRFLLILAVVGMVMTGAVTANATCVQQGKIVEIYMPTGAALATIYVAQFTNFPVVYYVYTIPTSQAAQIATLSAAMGAGQTVYVNGNATACATAGTLRAGGSIINFYTYTSR